MTDTLLIELLTEELPPKSLLRVAAAFAHDLKERLLHAAFSEADGSVIAFSTPRRLAVLIEGVRAVQLERETGKTFVERVVGSDLVRTEVQLGLRDEQFSEVREGLAEGETLAIRNRSGQEQLRSLFGGG